MNRSYRVWYLLALLLAILPAGVRAMFWQKPRSETAVDSSMADAGKTLFARAWKAKDALCPQGDGLGPVFNATSCVACHHMGGPGGAGGIEHNVTTFTVRHDGKSPREGVVHTGGLARAETLSDVHGTLPAVSKPTLTQIVIIPGRNTHCLSFPTGVNISQRNTPALFGSKLIDEIPERAIVAGARQQRLKWGMALADSESVPVGRPSRLADGRIGRFGWKGQMASLSDFVQAACANELGLSNPGQRQPAPLYMMASTQSTSYDLTIHQCDQLTAFCASLPRPTERLPVTVTNEQATAGKKLFTAVGCAECHTPNLGNVEGIYSDLLLHSMGQDLVGGGSYGEPPVPIPGGPPNEGPSPSEWRTPPLWGVATSAPYLHDGRAFTLDEAIRMHGGQGARAARNFAALSPGEQRQLIAFLETLQAP